MEKIMTNVQQVERVIDDFTVSFNYIKKDDTLNFSCDRDLKNIDILLMVTQLLSMVDEEHRDTIINLSKETILLKKRETLQ